MSWHELKGGLTLSLFSFFHLLPRYLFTLLLTRIFSQNKIFGLPKDTESSGRKARQYQEIPKHFVKTILFQLAPKLPLLQPYHSVKQFAERKCCMFPIFSSILTFFLFPIPFLTWPQHRTHVEKDHYVCKLDSVHKWGLQRFGSGCTTPERAGKLRFHFLIRRAEFPPKFVVRMRT